MTRGAAAGAGLALAVFGAATAVLYAPLLGEDWSVVVPSRTRPGFDADAATPDRRFVVWLVARNADAWLHHPWRLLDPGTCHPVENALTLGHPALSLGLLGVPGLLVTGDPVTAYTTAVVLQTLLAALAMYLLVVDWTRSSGAGIVAGLLYAFLPGKTGFALYPFHGDTAWLLLALLFARRLLSGGGAGAAAGVAVFSALQLATSFYAFLAALCLALPLAAWLWHTRDAAALRPGPVAGALVALALAATAVFGPFFLAAREGALGARQEQVFASAVHVWPPNLTSWTCTLLALLGLVLPTRLGVPALRGNPRVALVAGAALAALLATSAAGVYPMLARVLPGLDTVRVPAFLVSGVHLAACLLAGMGAAGLARALPRSGRGAAWALAVALVFVDTLRPAALGLEPRSSTVAVAVRPPEAEIEFFDRLAALGNRGPVLEAPVDHHTLRGLAASSRRVLLQAFHRRRTSSCYNSFVPGPARELEAISARLPAPEALAALAERGFTTLVVRRSLNREQRRWNRRIARASETGSGLTPILEHRGLTAYAIRPPATEATPRSAP